MAEDKVTLTTTRILVLTTEPLPLNGCASTGAGLRAWGLFKGLQAHHIEAVIATPASDNAPCTYDNVFFFKRGHLSELIDEVQPSAIVMQHWGLMSEMPDTLSVPLAIDLAGPHLLERQFWGSQNIVRDLNEKLTALRKADFVTVSGAYQRHYFYPFLSMAGYDLRSESIPIIPFSVEPFLPEEKGILATAFREPYSFVYGGMFLAWQNPEKAIRILLEEMDAAGKGKLYFFGGTHPVLDASGGRFSKLTEFLKNHPRVEFSGIVPYEELTAVYKKASVALDLMEFNPERELAYTTRTMVYLRCGLPVLHDNYSELGERIEKTNSGWGLAPDDEESLHKVIRSILSDKTDLNIRRHNALSFAESHDWNETVLPLVQWCKAPYFRKEKGQTEFSLVHDANELNNLRKQYQELSHQYDTLRGKWSVRLASKWPALTLLLVLPAWICSWMAVLILKLRFASTCKDKK